MDNQKNIFIAIALSLVLFLGWDIGMRYLYPPVDQPDAPTEQVAETERARPTRDGGLQTAAEIEEEERDLETSLAVADRVAIEAPAVTGSINPVGARLDDLTLNRHRQTVEEDSGPARQLSPAGTPAQAFAQFGWIGEGVVVPDAQTVWSTSEGALSPDNPVTLSWDNGAGQTFAITFSVDENYMFTAEQSVINAGDGSVALQPYAFINRTSLTASLDTWNVQSGPIGSFGEAVEFGWDYDDVDDERMVSFDERVDWIGFTDVYWLSALVPQDGSNPDATFRALGNDNYRADLIYAPVTVAAGSEATTTTLLFSGAKESDVLAFYEEQAGIVHFSRTIDWGWFELIEKPILWLLKHLFDLVGNFGVAIMLLTVIIRGAMFPIAQKQFASMAAMRAIQPKMKAIQERYKDDKQTQQQKIMAMYKEEGVNPLAGCLPIFLQIPIFFALYKVLLLAIDMRHQPFILWLKDLSAPDPLHILNLFGLLDFTPPSFLGIGILAVLLGVSMWLQFKLNPTAMDPVQQQMFMIMPWFMMFIMAPFAAGLLLYWITSNVLTIAQQAFLYSRHPQLKAQADKKKEDIERIKTRESKKDDKG